MAVIVSGHMPELNGFLVWACSNVLEAGVVGVPGCLTCLLLGCYPAEVKSVESFGCNIANCGFGGSHASRVRLAYKSAAQFAG